MARIFGPVPSRRLGRSLGIDVIPYKTCTFDCVYCECGSTTDLTCERREFYPPGGIIAELGSRLEELKEQPDVLTLSGAGEPTLYSGLGKLIEGIKEISSLPVAVITNSSLLHRTDVRDELALADIVLPSLDSALEDSFARVNRPHSGCPLGSILEGLGEFCSSFRGKIFLEILLIRGFNDSEKDIEALRRTVAGMDVDLIQLNTAVRPGTEKDAEPLDLIRLEKIRTVFGGKCEIVASASARASHEDSSARSFIMTMIERRPCTAEDINRSLGIPRLEVIKFLGEMLDSGLVVEERRGDLVYYTAVSRDSG